MQMTQKRTLDGIEPAFCAFLSVKRFVLSAKIYNFATDKNPCLNVWVSSLMNINHKQYFYYGI